MLFSAFLVRRVGCGLCRLACWGGVTAGRRSGTIAGLLHIHHVLCNLVAHLLCSKKKPPCWAVSVIGVFAIAITQQKVLVFPQEGRPQE